MLRAVMPERIYQASILCRDARFCVSTRGNDKSNVPLECTSK